MSLKPILGYWNTRALGQPIRILLAYLNVDFEEKRYTREENAGQEWFDAKYSLGLDFPNIPYLIDGDLKLTHSIAILQYLAQKYDLNGATEQEKTRLDLLEQVLQDNQSEYLNFINKPNYQELKFAYLESVKSQLKSISNFFGSGLFLLGDKISYVDFLLYEYLIRISLLAPKLLNKFDELSSFPNRIEQLHSVEKYLEGQEPMFLNGTHHYWNVKY